VVLVSLSGRLSASAYVNSQGEPKAQIECNVSNFQVHARKDRTTAKQPEPRRKSQNHLTIYHFKKDKNENRFK
jgi:hypothetical protein